MALMSCDLVNSENCRLLRMPDVIDITGLPRSTIYLKVKNKQFPSQVQISSRSVAWIESEVHEWINEHIKKRNANE